MRTTELPAVKVLLAGSGMTVRQWCAKSGVAWSLLYMDLRGERGLSTETVLTLVHGLDVAPAVVDEAFNGVTRSKW